MAMSNDELQQLLLATFADQAKEQLQTINERLLALEEAEGDDNGPLLEEIFREAHSLKGASRAVDLGRVEAVAHKLESLFSVIQKGELEADGEVFDLAYKALDALTALVEEGLSGTAADVDVDGLCNVLTSAAEAEVAGRRSQVAEGEAPAEEANPAAKKEPAKVGEPKSAEPDPQSPIPDPQSQAKPAPKAKKADERDETVRVATSKLDALMAQVGELLAARIGAEHRMAEVRVLFESVLELEESWRKSRPARTLDLALEGDEGALADARQLVDFLERSDDKLRDVRNGLGELRRKFEADSRRMAQVTTDLQDDVRRTRMLPVSTIFDTFPRMVRDLTRELSKEVKLTIEGGETEVDKQVLEQLRSPLTHMVRNCVDHGMEDPGAREAAGKPREGKVVLAAYQRAADLVIEVVDDGAGIDVEKVKGKAIEKGLITANTAEGMAEREALWLIFRSGFSTKPEVTDLSGRGVGMDVVREHIERLHGVIDVESTLGKGSKFTLSVPLSVATTRCLLVQAGDQTFGIPTAGVERIVRLSAEDIGHTQGREAIRLDERPMALLRLCDVLGIPSEASDAANQPAIVLGSADRRAAFLVDGLLGAQEIATKMLPKPLVRVRHIAAATIVGTGEVVPILNVLDLLRASASHKATGHRPQATAPVAPTPRLAPAATATRRRVDLVAIGSSTGGPDALGKIIGALPARAPVPILIVQHITVGFHQGLVDWLNTVTPLTVKLGEEGHLPVAGEVILAPGEHHMSVDGSGRLRLTTESPVRGHRPSATHLFHSVASVYGAHALGVILTGMGHDGADGLVELRRAGGWVIGQDEATCVVYGMPREAAARGGVSEVLSLPEIAGAIIGSWGCGRVGAAA